MDLIEKEFGKKAIIRGGIYLFNSNDALELIKKCLELNKKILGIDSFRITENSTQPVSEYSIDFSTKKNNDGNWAEAEKLIQDNSNRGLVFEIVYE